MLACLETGAGRVGSQYSESHQHPLNRLTHSDGLGRASDDAGGDLLASGALIRGWSLGMGWAL
jgi:hypothetical protein